MCLVGGKRVEEEEIRVSACVDTFSLFFKIARVSFSRRRYLDFSREPEIFSTKSTAEPLVDDLRSVSSFLTDRSPRLGLERVSGSRFMKIEFGGFLVGFEIDKRVSIYGLKSSCGFMLGFVYVGFEIDLGLFKLGFVIDFIVSI